MKLENKYEYEALFMWMARHPQIPNEVLHDFELKFDPTWTRPVLREFTKDDWFGYAGVESNNPRIANLTIEGKDYDLVVEDDLVGLHSIDMEEQICTSYVRDFGRNDSDEFFQESELGGIFAEWFLDELNENSTEWEITNRFGFVKA